MMLCSLTESPKGLLGYVCGRHVTLQNTSDSSETLFELPEAAKIEFLRYWVICLFTDRICTEDELCSEPWPRPCLGECKVFKWQGHPIALSSGHKASKGPLETLYREC